MDVKHLVKLHLSKVATPLVGAIGIFSVGITLYHLYSTHNLLTQKKDLQIKSTQLSSDLSTTQHMLASVEAELTALKNEDQFKINRDLQAEIKNIQTTYQRAVSVYEDLLDYKVISKKTDKQDAQFTKSLVLLSQRNYASASALLNTLSADIQSETQKLVGSITIPDNVAAKNTPPGAGYSRQRVDSSVGSFLVDIIAADLGGTRVIVDTASNETCRDNCPVAALGDYAARSGAFAGINGPYFCPASYPSCAGKTNSFDTLLMNKNKVYFNSDNNVYSTVPAVIFSGSSARFVGRSLDWGRDTSVDSVITAQPMLLSGGNVVFGGDGEAKRGSRGSRSFIGTKGSTVYIGIVQGATVAEVAQVLKTLGLENALNLDSGGSTALWSGGRYIVGPGRQTPFGILFVRR